MRRGAFLRRALGAALMPMLGRLPLPAAEPVAAPAFSGFWTNTATTTTAASRLSVTLAGDSSALVASFARAAEHARRNGETVSWAKRTGERLINGEREYVRGLA